MTKILPSAGDRDPFLTTLDARLAALQQLRASYVAARAIGAIGPSTDPPPAVESTHVPSAPATPPAEPMPPRRGAITAHVTRCLYESAQPLRVRDLVRALRQAGIVSPRGKAHLTVSGILNRMAHRGQVTRTAAGWVATDGGPLVPSSTIEHEPAAPAAQAPASIAIATAPPPSAPSVQRLPPYQPIRRARKPRPRPTEPTADRRPDGLAWRIESLLKSHGQPVAARYVADRTGEPLNVVGLTLGRMIRQQRVEKDSDGHFAVVVPVGGDTAGADKPSGETTSGETSQGNGPANGAAN